MGVTRVNSASISGTGTTSAVARIPNGTGILAGDLIIVSANCNGTHVANGMSVQDSVNATNYTTIKEQDLSSASSRWLQTFFFVTPVNIADGSTVTLTAYAGSAAASLAVDIFRGVTGTISNAAVGVSPSAGSTCAAPALAAAPPATNLVLSFVSFSTTASSLTVASPFTKGSASGNTTPSVSTGYVLSADGSSTYGVTWTNDSSQSNAAVTVAFAAAAISSLTFSAQVSPTWKRQFRHPQTLLSPPPPPPAAGVSGVVQNPQAIPQRRSTARAVWYPTATRTTNLLNGTVPDHLVIARRSAARAVWKGFVSSTTNLLNGNNPDGVVYRRRAARAVIYGRAVPPQIPVPASGRLVARRTAARAVWRGFISSTTNLYNGNPPDGVVYRRKSARAVVHGNPAPFPPPIGTVPDHLVIARRSTARAVWHGSAVPPQVARTAQGKSVARRLPARAVWYPTRTSTTNLLSGDQPGSGLVRRRQSARAVWAGTVSRTINVQPTVSGTAPLHLVVARRGSARAVWKGFVSSTTNLLYGNPPDGLVKRRSTARAVWAGTVSRTVNAIPTVSGTVPDHLVVARRASARAFWRGFVSKTTNAVPGSVQPAPTAPVRRHVPARVVWRGNAVPGQQPHPETGGLVRRRIPARGTFHGNAGSPPPPPVSGSIAPPPRVVSRRPPSRGQWRGVTVRTTNAIPVAVRAPRQRLTVPRRTSARAEWAGTVSRTQNAVATIRFSLGIPGFRWKTSSPDKNWQVP